MRLPDQLPPEIGPTRPGAARVPGRLPGADRPTCPDGRPERVGAVGGVGRDDHAVE